MGITGLDTSLDVRHYFNLLWRRKGIVILAAVTVLCGALIALLLIPVQYDSHVRMLIEDQQSLIRELEQIMGRASGSPLIGSEAEKARLAKVAGRIRSRPFLERVARITNMTGDPAVRAAAEQRRAAHPELSVEDLATRIVVEGLQSRIRVSSSAAGIYDVIVTDSYPSRAEVLARYVSSLFEIHLRRSVSDQIGAALDFATEQLSIYEEELRRSEEALGRYQVTKIKEEISPSAVRPENLGVAVMLQKRLHREAADAQMRLDPLVRDATQAGLPTDDSALREDAEVRKLEERLAEALNSSIDERLAAMKTESPGATDVGLFSPGQDVLRINLRSLLQERAHSVYPEIGAKRAEMLALCAFHRIDAQMKSDVARTLDDRIRRFNLMAESQPGDEFTQRRLEEDVATKRQRVELFRSQGVASELRQRLEAASLGMRVEILDPAELPLEPSRPNRRKILLAAFFIGPLLGAALAFLLETMDPTLRSLHEIQRLSPEPILCTTPLLTRLKPRPQGLRRRWIPVAISAVILVTLLFVVARMTILRDLRIGGESVRVVDTGLTESESGQTR